MMRKLLPALSILIAIVFSLAGTAAQAPQGGGQRGQAAAPPRPLGVDVATAKKMVAAGKPIPVTITSPPAGAWEITIGQGGLPILKDGKVVAAMGCGGSLPANDEKFCRAGIDAMGK